MSYGNEKPDPVAVGWAFLAEWTGGLPPEQVQALASVRPLEAVHSLLRGLAGRTPRELLARAAVLESLESSPGAAIDESLTWLAEPARAETLSALRGSGWLEPGPHDTLILTAVGRRVWDALRRSTIPREPGPAELPLPEGVTPEQIVRALLAHGLDELAAAGRDALVPIVPAISLLSTDAIARAAEAQARTGDTGETRDTGDRGRRTAGKPAKPEGSRRR
jgi:DNA-binding transcriptional ArsR family regulator